MTTPRTRRTKPQQVEDGLRAWLKAQEAKVAASKQRYDEDVAERDKIKRALDFIDQKPLPGFTMPEESERIGAPVQPIGEGGTGEDLTMPAMSGIGIVAEPAMDYVESRDSLTAISVSRPHGQRIGEKSISDVWPLREGAVEVHTATMYARQDACEWCGRGIPFATEKRTEHRLVTTDDKGVERGLFRKCEGAAT